MTTRKTFLAQTAAAIGGFIVRGRPSPSNTLLPKQLSSQLNNEYNDAAASDDDHYILEKPNFGLEVIKCHRDYRNRKNPCLSGMAWDRYIKI